MASPNLSELVTMALRNRSGVLADNVTDNNALLKRLQRRGKIKPYGGGRTIVQELEYQENSTYTRYAGYQVLDTSPSDVFTAAEFDMKMAAVAVTISGEEQLKVSGEEAMFDLLESRIANAERTLTNNIAADCYSDGTANGSKQIGGLQLLVEDSPSSSTVGGIARGTWSFWRNIAYDVSDSQPGGTTVLSSTNVQTAMNALYVQLVRGSDKPDLIIADNVYWRYYLESLQNIQRITDDEMASAGFMNIAYMNAPVVLDGGQGGGCPASHMYFLNTNYIHFRPHRDRNFVPLDDERFSTNQDAMVKFIGWAGNMTLSNASLQGVIKA